MRPALACLKIVILETVNISASSSAVKARPIRSIRSASDNGSAEPLSLADRIERIGRALTADELAEMLTVSRITIFKQAKAGRIPSFRVGTCVRFDPRSVAQWLRRN